MTDTVISEATIAELGKLPADAKAAARDQMAKHYSAQEIERAFGATVKPSDKPEAAPPPRTMTVADDALDFDQTAKGLAALYKHASPDMQARVLAQAKARGIAAETVTGGAAVAPEVVSAEARIAAANADPAFRDPHGPPSDASTYRLEWPDASALAPEALARRDAETREAFRVAEVPVSHAQAILDAITATAALYPEGRSDADKELTKREQGAILRRTFGEAEAERIVADASALYFKMPEVWRKAIDDRNGFASAAAQVALAQSHRALAMRRKK